MLLERALRGEASLAVAAKVLLDPRAGRTAEYWLLQLAEVAELPEQRLRALELQAHIAVKAGLVDAFHRAHADAIALSPTDPRLTARFVRAVRARSPDAAAQAIARHLAVRPNDPALLTLQAKAESSGEASFHATYDALKALAEAQPGSAEIAHAFAAAAGRLHRWSEADQLLRSAMEQIGSSTRLRQAQRLASIYAAAQARTDAAGKSQPSVRIIYINLDRDSPRRERMEQWYTAAGLPLERLPGVLGAPLPMFVVNKIARRPREKLQQPGTLGCFVSHVAAWERAAQADGPTLILEDDSFPLARFGADLEAMASETRDILFVNQRMSSGVRHPDNAPGMFGRTPLPDMVRDRGRPPLPPGGDAYILSPGGARKLLGFVEADGLLGHVDVHMLSYCMRPEDLGVPPETVPEIRGLQRYWSAHQGDHRLEADVLYPPLTQALDFGQSVRAGD